MKSLVLVVFVFSAFMQSCNFTYTPLCSEKNAVDIPGITGVYELSLQNPETFVVNTQKITIMPKAKGLIGIKINDLPEESVKTCMISGRFIQETAQPKVGGYKQEEVHVTGMGISVHPLIYDSAAMARDQIPYKIFEIPEELQDITSFLNMSQTSEVLFSQWSGEHKKKGIIVVNENLTPEKTLRYAKTFAGGFTLFRL